MSPAAQARALGIRGKLRLWGVIADFVLALVSYEIALVCGLYKLEAWVSHPLHAVTLFKARSSPS